MLDVIASRLRECAQSFHAGVEDAPIAALWTDPESAWLPIVAQLQILMPELLVLGDYAPEKRTGPVVWLKCAIAGKAVEPPIPAGVTPVLYLPGVSRHELRNADQCRWEIQPLVELLYRGTIWSHRNGRDWTIEGFFQAEEGLGLDVAGDEQTRLSLRSALSVLAKTPLSRLRRNGRLEASDFDAIVIGDTPRDVLTWIGSPEATRKEWGSERWHAFRSRCMDEFGFDPEKETPLAIAEHLGRRESDRWRGLWDRFCEAPALYEGVREALDRAQPKDLLALDAEPWPAENAKREDELRAALLALENQPAHVARQSLADLEKQHAARRAWVWADLGEAPLAKSLEFLHCLAEATRVIPSCETADQLVQWYVEAGWQADEAARVALQSLSRVEDEAAMHRAIRSVYAGWLDELARSYQQLVSNAGYPLPTGMHAQAGECLLFVDGLRYDVGQTLADLLEKAGLRVARDSRMAALPTATPTAKPAVAPIAGVCSGGAMPSSFAPNGPDKKELSSHSFSKALETGGYLKLKESESIQPLSDSSRGWIETGRLDSRGHDLGAELAAIIPGELARVVSLVEQLLGAGWRKVTIITDHGWLLMPGGLAKFELPGFLVESRWARCAAIKGQSTPEVPTVPWHWNPAEHVAIAPGARVFKKGEAYAHGGVSLQECVTPILHISQDGEQEAGTARITEVRWKRLRCVIQVQGGSASLKADIRRSAADAATSISTTPKAIEADGEVSLLVSDEDLAGRPATIVLLSPDGAVVAKAETTIGGTN
jgi:hypothetical protein